MTTKRDYAASITTKGLDGTGLTEDVARKLYSRRGRKAMAVVELVVDETSDKRDGTHKVALAIAGLELVLDHTDIENHLRDLQQTIYANRQRADGQMAIDEQLGGERTVADVLASGKSHRPHPFIVVDASVENPICDVCGGIEASAVHSTQDVLEGPDGDESDDVGDDDSPHAYQPKTPGAKPGDGYGLSCVVCGRHEDEPGNGHVQALASIDDDPDGVEVTGNAEPDEWAYDGPEGTATTIPDPFTAPA